MSRAGSRPTTRRSVLLAPDSLKGCLRAPEVAATLGAALRTRGIDSVELPIGDGGEGTAESLFASIGGVWDEVAATDALGRPLAARLLTLPDGSIVVEAAEAIGLERLSEQELDPLAASSRGLGELLCAALARHPARAIVCLGGTATVDGGHGVRQVVTERFDPSIPVHVACDVENPLLGPSGAAAVFGPQKGATVEQVAVLERRLAAMSELTPFAHLPGAGAAGGLGAALAALGAELIPGAELVLDLVGFDELAREATLVVTGEGRVDPTTLAGKAAGVVARRAHAIGTKCVVFGGVVEVQVPDAETVSLSGDPRRIEVDLEELAETLADRVRAPRAR